MAKSLEQLLNEAIAQIQEVDTDDLARMMRENKDLLILDVREAGEVSKGFIGDALHIPRGVLEGAADLQYRTRHPVLSQARQRPVVVYCHSGVRSAFATHRLQQMGFQQVYNLKGGYVAWVKDNREVNLP